MKTYSVRFRKRNEIDGLPMDFLIEIASINKTDALKTAKNMMKANPWRFIELKEVIK